MKGGRPGAFSLTLLILLLIPSFLVDGSAFAEERTATLEKGIAEYQDESYEEAIITLEKALKEAPQSAAAAYYLGLSYKKTLNHDSARSALEKALLIDASMKESFFQLAEVYLSLNLLNETDAILEKAERSGVDSSYLHYLKGLSAQRAGENKKALEAFGRVGSQDDADLRQRSAYATGETYLAMRRTNEAGAEFERAIALQPPHRVRKRVAALRCEDIDIVNLLFSVLVDPVRTDRRRLKRA